MADILNKLTLLKITNEFTQLSARLNRAGVSCQKITGKVRSSVGAITLLK